MSRLRLSISVDLVGSVRKRLAFGIVRSTGLVVYAIQVSLVVATCKRRAFKLQSSVKCVWVLGWGVTWQRYSSFTYYVAVVLWGVMILNTGLLYHVRRSTHRSFSYTYR